MLILIPLRVGYQVASEMALEEGPVVDQWRAAEVWTLFYPFALSVQAGTDPRTHQPRVRTPGFVLP
jgi:hypothetical protein